jgi:membrane-bound lytic murein transglycosylase MltF
MYEKCQTDTELDAITRFSGNAKTTYSTNRFKKAIRTVNRTRKTYLAIAGILNDKQLKEYDRSLS